MKQMKNTKERICAFLLVAAMLVTGIMPNTSLVAQAANTDAYFFVYEQDQSGNKVPIKGAKLTINGAEQITDEDGKCSFKNVEENAEIEIKRDGYKDLDSKLTVNTGTTEEKPQEIELTMDDIRLKSDSVILQKGHTGTVEFEEGNKISEANSLAYKWSVTEGENYVSIKEDTGEITAKEKGSAKVKVERNGKSAEKEITVKDKFTMNVTADPMKRPDDGNTTVKVTVTGIPEDAGDVTVTAQGLSKNPTRTVTAVNNTAEFDIPDGKFTVTFIASFTETDSYFATEASTDVCTYKQSQSISIKSDFATSYTYGDKPIAIESAVLDANGRNVQIEVQEPGTDVLEKTNNNELKIIGAGTATVKITAEENDDYMSASTTCEITVDKKNLNVSIRDIIWNPTAKVYDGTTDISLTGNLPDNCGVVLGDVVTVTAKGQVSAEDKGTYGEFNYIEATDIKNDKYEITLDASEKDELSITGGSIKITARPLYIQVQEKEDPLSVSYGTSKKDIEAYLLENAEVELAGNQGGLDSDSGLVNTDSVQLEEKVSVALKGKDDDSVTYYVGTYSDAIQPVIDDNDAGNYELRIAGPVSDYSGTLEIVPEVIGSADILGRLKIGEGQDGVYQSDDAKIWVKDNTSLSVESSDSNYTEVWLKREDSDSHDKDQILLSAQADGIEAINDLSVYLKNANDISGKTRSTSEKDSLVDTLIPEGKIFVDNELPTVEFEGLGCYGNTATIEKFLNFMKFSNEEYNQNVSVSDHEGSGIKQVYSKVYEINPDRQDSGLITDIKSAAVSADGWTENTNIENGNFDVSVPETEGYRVLLIKVIDNVGNEVVYSSNGIIVDTTAPELTIDPDNQIDSSKTYNVDIEYKIQVKDALSGIDKLVVQVKDCDGKEITGSSENHTDSFTLENLVEKELNGSQPTKDKLNEITQKTYEIPAVITCPKDKSMLNMSIQVTAYDKAGNEVASQEKKFNFDKIPPKAQYSYDNNEYEIVDENYYFKDDRTMEIVYTERDFDPEKAVFKINVDGTDYETDLKDWNKELEDQGVELLTDQTVDSEEGAEVYTDNRTITYQIQFGSDEEEHTYQINEIGITDGAGNPGIVSPSNENEPATFIIDKKAPDISITYNLGDSAAKNKKYFSEKRIMYVTYTETYFSEENVKLRLTSEDDEEKTLQEWLGKEEENAEKGITIQKISDDEQEKTNHEYKYQITFGKGENDQNIHKDIDQDYEVVTSMVDHAGNKNNPIVYGEDIETTRQSFTVDQIAPKIEVEYTIGTSVQTAKPQEENRVYTNKQVIATVTITERNFRNEDEFVENQMQSQFIKDTQSEEDIQSEEDKINNANCGRKWTYESADRWTQDFVFDVNGKEDSDFSFKFTYQDLAANAANNGEDEEYFLTIDKLAPQIEVSYYHMVNKSDSVSWELLPKEEADLLESGERLYRQNELRAVFRITERNFVRGSEFQNQMNTVYEVSKNNDTVIDFEADAKDANKWEYSADEYVACQKFEFTTQANYTIGMTYTDLAGNVCIYNNKRFTIDWTAPRGSITLPDSDVSEGNTWSVDETNVKNDGILSKLFNIIYNFFTDKEHRTTMEGSDSISGIANIYYYIDNSTTSAKQKNCLSEEELNKLEGWKEYVGSVVMGLNSQSALYEKIVDKSGNVTYLNAAYGVIVDNKEPVIQLRDVSPSRNGLHSSDVNIQVTVTDPLVNGVYAGIEKVEYSIESTTNKIAKETGTVNIKYDEGNGERKHSGTGTIRIDGNKFNSNDVTVIATVYDSAGNSDTDTIKVAIDTTAPVIEDIQWNTSAASNGKYYNVTRVATITVRERNFDPNQVRLNITNTDGTAAQVSGWSVDRSGTSDNNINTCTVTFASDGDYNMNVSCTDKAGWDSNTVTIEEFTIDKTAPKINVSFDNNDVANGKYYKASRTATITVDEHNFNGSDVKTAITSNTSTPGVHGWSGGGDSHSATVPFTTDGEYSFTVNYTDLAGNAAEVYNVDQFVIDLTKPEIEIFDIEDKSANNGEVAPGVRYSDTNYDVSGVSITYSGAKHSEEAVDGTRASIPNGQSIKMADFPHTVDADDVYTMVAKVTDLAGNSEEKQVTFSVNRFGSNFIFSDETEEFLNDYYNNEEENLVVTEINVDTLTHRGITVGHDGSTADLKEGSDYTVKASGSEVSWKSYQYTIAKENFEAEGVYSVTIDSVDRATNQQNNKIKEANIDFIIDKTAPTVVITGIEDGGQYRSDTRDITVAVSDNVATGKVDIYKNIGTEESAETYEEDVINKVNGELSYTITSSSDWQDIKAVAVDKAGNVTDTSLSGDSDTEKWVSVLVTSNVFVQFYRNTPLFIGTILVVIVIGGGIIFFLFKRRRREDENKQQNA